MISAITRFDIGQVCILSFFSTTTISKFFENLRRKLTQVAPPTPKPTIMILGLSLVFAEELPTLNRRLKSKELIK